VLNKDTLVDAGTRELLALASTHDLAEEKSRLVLAAAL
jgi:hypothetical protein